MRRRVGPSRLLLLIGSMALLAFGSTFAANINIGTGAPVEFGQGISAFTACDSQILVTPYSTYSNVEEVFRFSRIKVSGIANSCNGKEFSIKAFASNQVTALPLYLTDGTTSYDHIRIYNDNGSFSLVGAGLPSGNISSGGMTESYEFIIDLNSTTSPTATAVALATDISHFTVESSEGVAPVTSPSPSPSSGPALTLIFAGYSASSSTLTSLGVNGNKTITLCRGSAGQSCITLDSSSESITPGTIKSIDMGGGAPLYLDYTGAGVCGVGISSSSPTPIGAWTGNDFIDRVTNGGNSHFNYFNNLSYYLTVQSNCV